METQADGLTRKALESRYQITRSNVYNRLSGLNKLGYSLTPDSDGYFNADQIALLDRLHAHLQKTGSSIATFPRIDTPQDSPIRQSYRTQDTAEIEIAQTQDISTSVLVELVSVIAHALQPDPDPLAHLAQLERAAAHVWFLTTGEVKGLIGVAPTHGMRRHGFMFEKMGQPGRSVEWKISKL